MFLLNNCKLLIFSDVRHGPTASHKRQELVNFGIQKRGCGCVCVRVLVLRARQRGQVGDTVALASVVVDGLRGRCDQR